jgi:hypothetical protein
MLTGYGGMRTFAMRVDQIAVLTHPTGLEL